MMGLTALGQGLYLVAGPFIGRIYSPEEFGLFGLFVTAWTFLGLFACGLFDMAIPAAASDEEAQRLSGLSVVLGVITSLVSGGALAIVAAQDWFGFGVLPIWSGIVMSAGMLTHMVVLIGQGWAVRLDKVMTIGQANVLMNGARSILQVLGGLLSPVWAMMIAAEIVARAAQAQWLRRDENRGSAWRFSWQRMYDTFRDNARYPIIFGPAFILDAAAVLIQTTMVGTLFGPAAMGQFFLMRRTLDLPVAFAFRSLSDLFLARQLAIVREDPARLRPFFLRTSAALALGGAAAGLPLIIWGRELFEIFYGRNWGSAGLMAAIMAPAFFLNLAAAPVARVFQISAMAHLRLLPGVVHVAGSLLVLILAGRYAWSIEAGVIGISAAISAQYVVYIMAGYFAAGYVAAQENGES
ncbi:lipopolysaccharide biosynthesis protein [Blastomonas sp.]|uniref:lipopolysaccharide biosynthesis protein n=1 Tax=Blastomonas sp. TaxID=1909299 RepID=UPI00406A8AC9